MINFLYAIQISLGVIVFSLIGSMIRAPRSSGGIVFNSLIGQIIVLSYIYLRSNFNEYAFFIPLTAYELWALAFIALLISIKKNDRPRYYFSTIEWMEIAAVFCIALPIAYCELPKFQMLSSDPDQHLFFASQVQYLGGITFGRPDWGGLSLGYPAGTGALIYAWSSLTLLSLPNVVSVLPLMETFLAPLAIAGFLCGRTGSKKELLFAILGLIPITLAGLTFPLMEIFFHQEGFGRLVSIGFVTLLALLLIDYSRQVQSGKRVLYSFLIGVTITVLVLLNPVNLIIPSIIIFSIFVIMGLKQFSGYWQLLISAALLPLILLDPYYLNLVFKHVQHGGAQITIPPFSTHLIDLNFLKKAIQNVINPSFYLNFFGFLVSSKNGFPFLMIFAPLALLPIALGKFLPKISILITFIALTGIFASAFFLLQGYSPFYLLYPYLMQSFAQYKVVAYQILLALGILMAVNRGWKLWRISAVLLTCLLTTYFVMNSINPETMKVRGHYCGGLGCASPSDDKVLTQFKSYKKNLDLEVTYSAGIEKILVANMPITAGGESWIFPYGGARNLPLYNIAPLAFYYFQGSPDYSVSTYMENICKGFNLSWLKERNIRYLFLPADRGPICIYDIDQVARNSKTLFREGESIVFQLY